VYVSDDKDRIAKLEAVCRQALAEVEEETGGDCGCNGTPPLCLRCALRDVLGLPR
jgi:hypothetical protein